MSFKIWSKFKSINIRLVEQEILSFFCIGVFFRLIVFLLDGQYFLIGSNRSRANPSYEWGEEFCALVYCIKNIDGTCEKYSTNQLKIFNHVKLTAIFDTKTVAYPSVLEYENRLIPMNNVWKFSSKIQDTKKIHELVFGNLSSDSFDKTYRLLSTLSIYGRAYERDPVYKQKPANW